MTGCKPRAFRIVALAAAAAAFVAMATWPPAKAQDEPASSSVTVVAYDFEDAEFRAAPSEVHAEVEAGPIMQPGFFPPTNRWFDGSAGGEPGEAIVARERPRFYEVTVEGLDRIGPLEELRFDVTTRRRGVTEGHVISVTTFANDEQEGTKLPLALYKPDDEPGEPTVSGVTKVGVGEAGGRRVEGQERAYLGWSGNTGTIVVDLSQLEAVELRRLRIHFDYRGHTAIDNVTVTAVESSQ